MNSNWYSPKSRNIVRLTRRHITPIYNTPECLLVLMVVSIRLLLDTTELTSSWSLIKKCAIFTTEVTTSYLKFSDDGLWSKVNCLEISLSVCLLPNPPKESS